MKTTILWDHDGVLVETEPWFFKATQISIRALGVHLEKSDYLTDMASGRSAWERAREMGATEEEVALHKSKRNTRYQGYLRKEDIEIPGVLDVITNLSREFQMAIVKGQPRLRKVTFSPDSRWITVGVQSATCGTAALIIQATAGKDSAEIKKAIQNPARQAAG